MKRSLIAAAMLLMFVVPASNADLIGLFGDINGTTCAADFPLYTGVDIHVAAILDSLTEIFAAEFRIELTPFTGADVLVNPFWETPLVIGSPFDSTGVALAFSAGSYPTAPLAYFGRINFFNINADWPGDNQIWCVEKTKPVQVEGQPEKHPKRVLVAPPGASDDEIYVDGWCFVANCSFTDCGCLATPVKAASWGEIKALF